MKIKLTDLLSALNTLKYDYSSYYGESSDEAALMVSIVEEDPSSGSMVDCLILSSESVVKQSNVGTFISSGDSRDLSIKRTIEIYDKSCGVKPRFSKTQTHEIK